MPPADPPDNPRVDEAVAEFWDLLTAMPMATQPDRLSQLRDLRTLILRHPAEAKNIIAAIEAAQPGQCDTP